MGTEKEETVLSNIDGNVGYITLNRPQHLNAFNLGLAEQFLKAVETLGNARSVRAIVIKGAGRVFSAGGDVREMHAHVLKGKDRAAYFRSPLAAFNRMGLSLRKLPKPVLAAVHGAVAGVAFNLMLMCDLKVAREGTRFTQAFIGLGLSPDGGGTYLLPHLVGYARACELTMLPREIDDRTALEWGLINRIASSGTFEREIKEMAEGLASGPAAALGRTKSLLNQAYDSSMVGQMEAERLAQIENAASEDFEEGLIAFLEKRRPDFSRHHKG
jgi:2-(1,2-epoxy-1,2-dihydrophenyl)acetyl-CoA isomerase